MAAFNYKNSVYPIRADLIEAYRGFWSRLAKPGSWWTGEQRIAIAAESRAALDCSLCATRKIALSPYAQDDEDDGLHGSDPATSACLPKLAIDAVHRIITDQSRITRRYIESNADEALGDEGLGKGAYVELVGVVVAIFSIDEFHRALDIPVEPLPQPVAGDITRYQPEHLSDDIGFVPTIPPDGAVGPEADLWPSGRTANVARALTLVPDALRDWQSIGAAQYLSFKQMENMGQEEGRALNRMQIEMIAGRVSSINECFY